MYVCNNYGQKTPKVILLKGITVFKYCESMGSLVNISSQNMWGISGELGVFNKDVTNTRAFQWKDLKGGTGYLEDTEKVSLNFKK